MTYATTNTLETLQAIRYQWTHGSLDIYSTSKLLSDDALDHASVEMGMQASRQSGFTLSGSYYASRSDIFAWHARHVLEAWRKDAV